MWFTSASTLWSCCMVSRAPNQQRGTELTTAPVMLCSRDIVMPESASDFGPER